MKRLSIKLHLKDHCIETAAKKKLRDLTDQYYNTENVPDILLQEIKFLQTFIEKSDFPRLRSEDERLSGTQEIFVRIYMKDDTFILNFE